MTILNYKKEAMQVAKLSIFLLFLTAVNSCAAQKAIKGTFHDNDPTLTANGVGVTYHFNDSTFKKTVYKHLGKKTRYGGNYSIIRDTLTLNFKPLKDPAPSQIKFSEKEPYGQSDVDSTSQDETVIAVNFQVTNLKDKPLREPALFIKNKEKEIIMTFLPDSIGNYPFLEIRDDYIHYFQFQSIRYKPLTISADSLAGYDSVIKVMLSDSQTYYSDYDGIKKYLIKEVEKNRIVLEHLETDQKLVLEQEGSN